MAYAGDLPMDCLPCQGQVESISQYPELFKAMGYLYSNMHRAPEKWWQRLWRKLRRLPPHMAREHLPVGMFRLPAIP